MYASRFRTRASIGAGYSIRYSSTGTRAFIRSSLEVEGTARAKTEGSQQVSLARLPKAIPGRFKSLHFRDVTPGSSVKLTNDFFQLHRPTPQKPYPNSDLYLDSTHPIHTYSFKDVPKYESAFLKIRAYPFARLAPHSQSSLPNPYTEEMKTQRRKTQLPMSLIVPMTPYNLHKSGAIRKVVRSRLKEALRLVVVRGARGSGDPDANSAVLDENDASSERWLIKDWTRYSARSPVCQDYGRDPGKQTANEGDDDREPGSQRTLIRSKGIKTEYLAMNLSPVSTQPIKLAEP
ncbi:hypothetical protein FRB90_010687 [Tulasnella sp. 427]|nr:hypothetical protein FRB90_010687 [Tulasnella sp. 427]